MSGAGFSRWPTIPNVEQRVDEVFLAGRERRRRGEHRQRAVFGDLRDVRVVRVLVGDLERGHDQRPGQAVGQRRPARTSRPPAAPLAGVHPPPRRSATEIAPPRPASAARACPRPRSRARSLAGIVRRARPRRARSSAGSTAGAAQWRTSRDLPIVRRCASAGREAKPRFLPGRMYSSRTRPPRPLAVDLHHVAAGRDGPAQAPPAPVRGCFRHTLAATSLCRAGLSGHADEARAPARGERPRSDTPARWVDDARAQCRPAAALRARRPRIHTDRRGALGHQFAGLAQRLP